MKFKYEAMDTTGLEIEDEIEADNEEEAFSKIRKLGYFATKVSQIFPEKTQSQPQLQTFTAFYEKYKKDLIYSSIIFILMVVIFGLLAAVS